MPVDMRIAETQVRVLLGILTRIYRNDMLTSEEKDVYLKVRDYYKKRID